MADQPKEPSSAELLERIKRLENENAEQRAHIAWVYEDHRIFMIGMKDEIKRLGDALWPVVGKVFPNFHQAKKKIDAIVPPCFVDPRINEKLDEKPS